MKGCARAALLQLGGFLVTVAAVMFLLHQQAGFPLSKTIGVSIFTGFFLFLSLGFLFGISKPVQERSAIRKALDGKSPADGKRSAFVGTIDATGERLQSPLSGKECVAWKYEIYEMMMGHRHTTKATYFEGIALTPSVITTSSGRYRLLSVPDFDFAPENVDHELAARTAEEHIRTATFETERGHRILEKQWTDDDGSYRSERRHPTTGEVDLGSAQCKFREDLIRRGDKVYAYGMYSQARGGIVPHANWAHQTRIMKGNGESVLRQLGGRIFRYIVGAILAGVAAAGLLWMFLSHFHKV